MVFSSAEFLFFLVFTLVGYYLLKRWRRASNLFLTFMSLGFYGWGEPVFVLVMLGSIFMNWVFGMWVDRVREDKRAAKRVMALMVIMNIGLLGVYKYLMFLLNTVNFVFRAHFPVPQIALPIGISFFTFQAMSYVIDVYRGEGRMQKNFFNVCLYVSFFPQLIAGPIVRYQTIADEIEGRRENVEDFSAGVRRFMVGFSKKMILANNLGLMVDTAFKLPRDELSVLGAWLAAFAYLLQVYYDFSGYSDMAIGLGRMFGFHFLENFEHPLIAKSVAGFWRRWHISLGTWFQDYLYIPLGGSRVGKGRLLFNMFVVWTLTGLWHGAAWTYALWGLGFFVLLAVERFTGLGRWMEKSPLGHLYAIGAVVVITVLIRSDSVATAGILYSSMFAISGGGFYNALAGVFLREYGPFLLAGFVCALPIAPRIKSWLRVPDWLYETAAAVALVALMVVSISYVATNSYNPFIYFNF
ncbi:MAG: MBOAT family protein [Clostridiales bacterium]|jgi:alginate O-acetyltransferase complex protein AlgI|nr:MBOAT family protein [Clostridiales bacterium]